MLLGIGTVLFAGLLVYTAARAYKRVGNLRLLFILTAFIVFLISGITIVVGVAAGLFTPQYLLLILIIYQLVSFALLYYGLMRA